MPGNSCGAEKATFRHTRLEMDAWIIDELRRRRADIKREWTILLRAEPVATPLGHPDALAFLVDGTLDEIFSELGKSEPPAAEERPDPYDSVRRECACERNPLLAYFLAGERALLEALICAQASRPGGAGPAKRTELTELYLVLRRIARREVRAFCSLCQNARPETSASHPSLMTTTKIAILAAFAAATLTAPALRADVPEAYAKNCASCHGQDGMGHTRAGKMLGVKDLSSADYQKSFTDDEAFKSLKEGYTDANGKQKMKPFAAKLSDDQIKSLVAFVRTLSK